jgi:ribonuclease I
MAKSKKSSRLEHDIASQKKIFDALTAEFQGVETEKVRLAGQGEIVTCIVLKLDGEFSLRASVNGGKVNVSVSDNVVQLQRMQWRSGAVSLGFAIYWIIGYVTGYRQ